MSYGAISQYNHSISQEQRSLISSRYRRITASINNDFWGIVSDSRNSIYVGSYGRGTAIETSDIDILIRLPMEYYHSFSNRVGNEQSQLLQTVRSAVLDTYPRSDVSGDGQVVVIEYSDKMKFEILPAFIKNDKSEEYIYPDSNRGGSWRITKPKLIQNYMKDKNQESNGLLFDTCKHIRYVRDNFFRNYELPGILIDTFVFNNISKWCWPISNTLCYDDGRFINHLLFCYGFVGFSSCLVTPGGGDKISISYNSWVALGKVMQTICG